MLEKLHVNLEQLVNNKKKSESDKNTYNITIKEKFEEKILQVFHEIEDKKKILIKTESEVKAMESFLNVIIESIIKNVISFCSNGFISLRKSFSEIGSMKLKNFFSTKDLTTKFVDKVKDLNAEISLINIEKVYATKMQLTSYGNITFLKLFSRTRRNLIAKHKR